MFKPPQSAPVSGLFRVTLAPGAPLKVKKIVLIFNVKKLFMLIFEHFWKCTPEMYPPPLSDF